MEKLKFFKPSKKDTVEITPLPITQKHHRFPRKSTAYIACITSCPICDYMDWVARLKEYQESMKGFWTNETTKVS